MSLTIDPCAEDCTARPLAPHTLVPSFDGDGDESPHSEHWACSCGHVVSSWTQSEPLCLDRPELECVLAAHAAHVAEAGPDGGDLRAFAADLTRSFDLSDDDLGILTVNAALRRALARNPQDSHLLAAAVRDAATWMADLADGGPDVRITAAVKLLDEAAELAARPDDVEEAADVAICLIGHCLRQGWTARDLAAAIEAKTAKNRTRTWAMGPNGAWQHVTM